jgi:uncharacterized membrane protein YtjA (UPF0391 family)
VPHSELMRTFHARSPTTSRRRLIEGLRLRPRDKGRTQMLKWAIIFAIISLVTGWLGFGGISGVTATIAKVLFAIFVILFIIALLAVIGVFHIL